MFARICLTVQLLCVSGSLGQTTNLVLNNAIDPATGADAAEFSRTTHSTFDLIGNTGSSDWTGSEISVDIVGNASIWHASDQRIAEVASPGDPDTLCYVHNLNAPSLENTAANRNSTRMWDTFFTGPGAAFMVDPQFISPGGVNPSPEECPPVPPIVSTATRIRGISAENQEIPLTWVDSISAPLNDTVIARLTLSGQSPFGPILISSEPQAFPLVAVIQGRTSSETNPFGTPFRFLVYDIPEPSSGVLSLGAAALLAMSRLRLRALRRE